MHDNVYIKHFSLLRHAACNNYTKKATTTTPADNDDDFSAEDEDGCITVSLTNWTWRVLVPKSNPPKET